MQLLATVVPRAAEMEMKLRTRTRQVILALTVNLEGAI